MASIRASPLARMPHGVRFGALATSGLLGRRAELAAIDEALERRSGVLAFSGEGGIGKTRLLDELAARAGDALVLTGRASELERELPFGVWEDALSDHAAFLGVDRLERLVGDQLPELAAVLPLVGRVPAGLQDERYRTHRAVRALLEGLARTRPVVLALDDLQWADDSSLETIAALLRRPPRGRDPARAGVPARAGAAAARHRAGDRRARRARDRAPAAHAVVRGRAVAARGRRSPPPCAGRSSRRAAATRSSCSSSRASTRRAAASPRSPARRACPRAVMRALEQEIAALERGGPRAGAGRGGRGRPGRPGPRDRRRRAERRRWRSPRSTSSSPARCWSPRTRRGAIASGTRWCGTRSTSRPRAAGGSARTGAPRRHCRRAAGRSPRGRITSSAARGRATPRR